MYLKFTREAVLDLASDQIATRIILCAYMKFTREVILDLASDAPASRIIDLLFIKINGKTKQPGTDKRQVKPEHDSQA